MSSGIKIYGNKAYWRNIVITRGVTIREGSLAIHGRWYMDGREEKQPTIIIYKQVCSDAVQARVRRIYI